MNKLKQWWLGLFRLPITGETWQGKYTLVKTSVGSVTDNSVRHHRNDEHGATETSLKDFRRLYVKVD